jgi:hypothetical protein
MDLENQTGFPARLLAANVGEEELSAAIIIKATYDLLPDNTLQPATECLPILPEALITPFGIFHGDHHLHQGGSDFCILGTIQRKQPVTQLILSAQVGPHVYKLRVTGKRIWRETGGWSKRIAPSEPEPFTMMPLSYNRAFGGKAEFNHEMSLWPDNPDGIGYYLTKEQAVGGPLPNIEPADGPHIQSWEDKPPVAGWGPYPMFWGLRARESVEVDAGTAAVKKIKPMLFNNAHPSMVVPEIRPGFHVRVENLLEQTIQFVVPQSLAKARINMGNRHFEVAAQIDGLILWADQQKVVLIQRAFFRYAVKPKEIRKATVWLETSRK